jgi:DNA repair exonuclease SbcCD ATPase subunit
MIGTCPHCQGGFYITPDLAGKIINCSKCKKQVRAPDRRSRGLSSDAPPNDGIPIAIIAETKAETEERLKNETDAKNELEVRLKQEQERLVELQTQLTKETEARKIAELTAQNFAEKLKSKGVSVPESELASLKVKDTETEKKLKEAIEAKTKIESQIRTECQAKTEALEKLKQEIQLRTDLEAKLKEAIAERTQIGRAHV